MLIFKPRSVVQAPAHSTLLVFAHDSYSLLGFTLLVSSAGARTQDLKRVGVCPAPSLGSPGGQSTLGWPRSQMIRDPLTPPRGSQFPLGLPFPPLQPLPQFPDLNLVLEFLPLSKPCRSAGRCTCGMSPGHSEGGQELRISASCLAFTQFRFSAPPLAPVFCAVPGACSPGTCQVSQLALAWVSPAPPCGGTWHTCSQLPNNLGGPLLCVFFLIESPSITELPSYF